MYPHIRKKSASYSRAKVRNQNLQILARCVWWQIKTNFSTEGIMTPSAFLDILGKLAIWAQGFIFLPVRVWGRLPAGNMLGYAFRKKKLTLNSNDYKLKWTRKISSLLVLIIVILYHNVLWSSSRSKKYHNMVLLQVTFMTPT